MLDYIMCVFILTSVALMVCKTSEEKYMALGAGAFTAILIVFVCKSKK